MHNHSSYDCKSVLQRPDIPGYPHQQVLGCPGPNHDIDMHVGVWRGSRLSQEHFAILVWKGTSYGSRSDGSHNMEVRTGQRHTRRGGSGMQTSTSDRFSTKFDPNGVAIDTHEDV